MGVLIVLKNGSVKLASKETKWTSLEIRSYPTFLETLILKYDFGSFKSRSGLATNRPPGPGCWEGG